MNLARSASEVISRNPFYKVNIITLLCNLFGFDSLSEFLDTNIQPYEGRELQYVLCRR